METIWTVRDIAERYKCTMQCARNYVRQMQHMEKPLAVFETDLKAWEESRTIISAKRRKAQSTMDVPRTREG